MTIKSFEDLDAKLLRLGEIQIDLTKKEASMNAKLQKIRDEYDKDTMGLKTEQASIEVWIEEFCKARQDDLDPKKRSKELTHGTVGFSKNPPSVLQLSKKWSVKSSIEFIKKLFPKKNYIRMKEEINKETILADYAAEKVKDAELAGVGLRIEQDDRFYYNIKWDEISKGDKAA